MCGGVEYKDGNRRQRIYFPNPKAVLPVRLRSGELRWLTWGRREDEALALPLGGWARLESIKSGKWDKYRPQPVLIAIERFMEKDQQGHTHWFEVPPFHFIQGLLATDGKDVRVYVVTVGAPKEFPQIHDRWPRLVGKPHTRDRE